MSSAKQQLAEIQKRLLKIEKFYLDERSELLSICREVLESALNEQELSLEMIERLSRIIRKHEDEKGPTL